MSDTQPPEHLRGALEAWARHRGQRREGLSQRDPAPRPGDLYSLPCHSWASPVWLVLDAASDGTVRLAPGDDRPWANAGDLWVGDQELCLRLENCVTVPSALLPADQRIGTLPDAPDEVIEHERAMRFVRPIARNEDDEQREWRAQVARTARRLGRFLADGVVELRLSEFRVARGSMGKGHSTSLSGEAPSAASPRRMAASSSGPLAAFLRVAEESDELLLVDDLDCDCGGSLQLVASRRGLGLLFMPQESGAVPPTLVEGDGTAKKAQWTLGVDALAHASRVFLPHDWQVSVLPLRLLARRELRIEVVDDGWFR